MWIRTKTTESGLFVISVTFPIFKYGYSLSHQQKKKILFLRRMWIFKDGKKWGWHRCYSQNPFMGLFMFEGFGNDVLNQMQNDKWKHRIVSLDKHMIEQITDEEETSDSAEVSG